MSLVVENGSALQTANGYVSVADANAHFAEINELRWMGTDQEKAGAIIRATTYLDAAYRDRFPGYQLKLREQGLEWPRANASILGAYGQQYFTLPQDQVPREIVRGTLEGALRELIKPGSLSPDIKQGGEIKSVTAGPVNVQFASGYTGQNIFQTLDMALSPILSPVQVFGGRIGRM